LGNRFGFLIFPLYGPDVICQQTRACAFKKIPLAPRPLSVADIEDLFFSTVEPCNYFLGRRDEAERACQIIGGTECKHAQWNAALQKFARDFCDRPVTSGGKGQVTGFL